MWVSASLSSSTFKPNLDCRMAADGTDVVLWATDRMLIRLSYRNQKWQVTQHAATADERASARSGAFCWCGRFYEEHGELIAALGDDATATDWDRAYRESLAFAMNRGALTVAS